MDNVHIQPVSPGQKVQAETINQLIDSTDFSIKATGARVHVGKDVNIQVNDQGQRMFSGQKFREPFDLSVGGTGTGIAVEVIRSHLPNTHGGFDNVQSTTVNFPTNKNIEIYLCEDKQGNKMLLSSDDDQLSAAQSKAVMWTFLSNGVVAEDSRAAALAAAYGKGGISLDLSSLNWVQVSSQVTAEGQDPTIVWNDSTSAQMWDYARLKEGDIADKAELTANNGWMFPVRPPNGEPHLKYVELSTMQDVVGGGGGGGACSCDLSVTPPATLSALGQDLVKIAAWTKDRWQTHVDILAPDVAKDIVTMANRMAYTPFYLRIRYNNGQPIMDIINNFFFYGREMKTLQNYSVTQTGTYYLEIETNQYGYYISRIVREASTNIPPAVKQNDDTHTYYPLWVVTSVNPTWDTGFPFDCRPMYITPFYSN